MSFQVKERVLWRDNPVVAGTVKEVDRDGLFRVVWDEAPGDAPKLWYDEGALLSSAAYEGLRRPNGLSQIQGIPEIESLEYITQTDPETGALIPIRDGDFREAATKPVIETSEDIYNLWPDMRTAPDEHIVIAILDIHQRMLAWSTTSKGGIDSVEAHLRRIVGDSLLMNGKNIVMLHNHPSGDPTPSPDDKDLTEEVRTMAEKLAMGLVDHVIVGRESEDHPSYFSFRDDGLLPPRADD